MDTPIDPLLYLTHPLNALLMFAMPVALGFYLTRRFKLGWSLWWIGAGTFILSQIGHLPFNSALTLLFQRGILPSPPAAWALPFNAVVLGLSAGLWEELARYATFRWWAKDARTWRKALLLGAGHGGIEAIVIGAVVAVTFVSMLSLRTADLSTVAPPDQIELARQQVTNYWGAAWPATLVGALERAFTIPVHISLAVLVLQAFTRRRFYWVWLAVLWHAAMDAAVVYINGTWGIYPAEAAVALFSLVSIAWIFALRQPEPEPAPAPEPAPLPEVVLPVMDDSVDPDGLDDSRYR